ncbi:hypothetical protein SDJN03_11585, partial [Cucurbita argyrosperma subsp. sororia]
MQRTYFQSRRCVTEQAAPINVLINLIDLRADGPHSHLLTQIMCPTRVDSVSNKFPSVGGPHCNCATVAVPGSYRPQPAVFDFDPIHSRRPRRSSTPSRFPPPSLISFEIANKIYYIKD